MSECNSRQDLVSQGLVLTHEGANQAALGQLMFIRLEVWYLQISLLTMQLYILVFVGIGILFLSFKSTVKDFFDQLGIAEVFDVIFLEIFKINIRLGMNKRILVHVKSQSLVAYRSR